MSRADATGLLQGGLGYFWPQEHVAVAVGDVEPRAGYVSQEGRGITISMLIDDVMAAVPTALGRRKPASHGIVGLCDNSGVVILDLVGTGGGYLSFGGGRASVENYRAQTLVATPEALDVEKLLLEEATIRFRSSRLFDWADQHAYESTVRTDPTTSLVTSATLDLLPTQPDVARLKGVGEVAVAADWSLGTRTETGVSVDLALELTVHTGRPRPSRDLLRHLGAIQVLISAVSDGFVTADGGWAKLPGLERRGALWNAVLMRDPTGTRVPPYHRRQPPFVDLPTLGGVSSLSRWAYLTEHHPRATAPIETRWRQGIATSALQLVECAVAIEYWVAAHRRSSAWARVDSFYPLVAARRASRHFADFVGDRRTWADRFWDTYNALKHRPHATLDEEETALLGESGYYLLLGILLDHAAGSKAPSRALFTHHRLQSLGSALRGKIGTAGKSGSP